MVGSRPGDVQMKQRLNCSVPGCTRTRGDRKGDVLGPYIEWICADHWKLVPRWMKAARNRARRRLRRAESILATVAMVEAWTTVHETARRADAAQWRLWKRLKRAAIERSVGL
ncbi:hypothetical protein JP75_07565 [Devosia riboflavina]|uniref:Uncharacterized protein n=1 Tax=Devosia riboflavina TaxID=46914 RepID=A0A087M3G0_9HYPH|nr:hypothetical protein JP75_07565 [Devosia riboflavina]